MSKKLALSSALSVLLMAGFALFGQETLGAAGLSGENGLLPARADMPAAHLLPAFPFQR